MTHLSEKQTKLIEAVRRRFPDRPPACAYWEQLLLDYANSGSSPPHLLTEIAKGEAHKFWTNVWEAMLYRHLCGLGVGVGGNVTKAGQHGPDFRIQHKDRTIWIEAVVPEPKGLPAEWLAPFQHARTRSLPHKEMLLRWTSVLKDKRDKFETYACAGIIGPNDCTVIAVNCCCLYPYPTDDLGISQLPFAVETAFAIGPLTVRLTPDGKIDGDPEHSPRFKIQKPSGVDVPTACFLDPSYANVSAIVSAYQNIAFKEPLAMTIVHNPLAKTPLPRQILGALTEYVAVQTEDEFTLSWLRPGLTDDVGA